MRSGETSNAAGRLLDQDGRGDRRPLQLIERAFERVARARRLPCRLPTTTNRAKSSGGAGLDGFSELGQAALLDLPQHVLVAPLAFTPTRQELAGARLAPRAQRAERPVDHASSKAVAPRRLVTGERRVACARSATSFLERAGYRSKERARHPLADQAKRVTQLARVFCAKYRASPAICAAAMRRARLSSARNSRAWLASSARASKSSSAKSPSKSSRSCTSSLGGSTAP